jgi:HD-GYP domain-containing protein (c-di-GMP phosphodiesterase class II)
MVMVCLVASGLTAGVAIGLQYFFGQSLAREAAVDLYASVSSSVASELRSVGRVNANVIELLANNPALREPDARTVHLEIFADVLEKNPLYYGVYLGRSDGSFFEVINLESSEYARGLLDALAGDRWVVVTLEPGDSGWTRHFSYLDEEFRETQSRSEPTDYEVTTRSWYLDALQSDSIQYSDPYIFAQLGTPGRTLSRKVTGEDVVVAIDMTLATLSRFLAEQRISEHSHVYLYDGEGRVIASSEQHQYNLAQSDDGGAIQEIDTVPSALLLDMAAKPELQDRLIAADFDGRPHLIFSAATTPLVQTPLHVGIISPRDAVVAPFLDKVELSILLTTGLLFLLLPLSWLIANPIVVPVRQLASENDKVRKREYGDVARVQTRVKELDELSDSMVAMVASIQAHEQAQRKLMDSIIELIAQAIDEKSAYTGGHCERVPELALMLARAAEKSDLPAFRDFQLNSDDEWREYRIAAWLHDCGKITTPEHVVDKGSKLEIIYNRIHEVRMRFEVLWRDARIDYLEKVADNPGQEETLQEQLLRRQDRLREDFAFVAQCNVGGEYLDQSSLDRLQSIAGTTWLRHFDDRIGLSPVEALRCPPRSQELPLRERLLADKPEHIIRRSRPADYPERLGIAMEVPEHLYNQGELYNLSVSRGTLTAEDRFRIQEHMISTIRMLDSLPFPEELKNVPRFASTHHETMDGRGYPRRLSSEQLSVPERLLAVADVFEALTASDRPYKTAKTVSESIDILYKMVKNHHIDPSSFELFIASGVYRDYAARFLHPEQIDEVAEEKYLEGLSA